MLKIEQEILPLTGLRFVAAFYVFLFHIHIRWPLANDPFLNNILGQGAIGMSLFFMLSGFVLAYRYADGCSSLKNYLTNRFARIYPIYVAAALVTVPWIGISFGDGSWADLSRGIGQLGLLITANILLIQAWFQQFFSLWNNGASWSISVEAFCYLMLPFLLPQLKQLSAKGLCIAAAVCWFLAVFPGLAVALFNAPFNAIFYSMPIFRLPEFLIGVCMLLLIRRGHAYRLGVIVQAALIAILPIYIGIAGQWMPLYVGHNWVVLPVIAFAIFSLANSKGAIAALLSSSLFVWLGKISYCFYSFQALVILFLLYNHAEVVSTMPILANNYILAIVAFVLLVAISALGYYGIEEPARRWIRRTYRDDAPRSIEVAQNAAT